MATVANVKAFEVIVSFLRWSLSPFAVVVVVVEVQVSYVDTRRWNMLVSSTMREGWTDLVDMEILLRMLVDCRS